MTQLGFRSKFRDFLGLTKYEVDHLFVGGDHVSLLLVCEKFMNVNDRGLSPAAQRRALTYCLMARYGFEGLLTDSLLVMPNLLIVVEQMEYGRNPIPLMLAETILGLDDHFVSRLHDYRGCP